MAINIPGLDSIKERLGFASHNDAYIYDESEQAPNEGDYGEYGYDDNAEYAQAGYGVSTRSRTTSPALVSSRDIRNFSQSQQRAATEAQSEDDGVIERDVHASTSYTANSGIRSQGLQGLFSSTASSTPSTSGSRVSVGRSNDEMRTGDYRFSTTNSTSRHISVIAPVTYEDAQRIARALRSGDVVVINVRSTPEATARRVLDFAFGAAAAFDARVEYIADRSFALATGAGLGEAERAKLRDQGVM
ncbi:MAG: cell division protein SepF [Eggerthellaceae bacterium]|nr:cell division protein SepF [Eggerthellaceae bacterium]